MCETAAPNARHPEQQQVVCARHTRDNSSIRRQQQQQTMARLAHSHLSR